MSKVETFDDPKAYADAVRQAQRQATRKRRPKERPALPRAKSERPRKTKLSFKRAQELGWQFGYANYRGHYAFQIGAYDRRVGYETTREDLLDALWEAGER